MTGTHPGLVDETLPSTATLGVGVFCRDPAGNVVVAHRPAHPRPPASNTKLLTTGIALDRLGPSYRARTRFGLDADGRLVIEGDRTLTTDHDDLTGVAEEIAGQVSQLSGIVLDVSGADRQPYGPAWTWGDEQRAYGARCSPLAVDGNVVSVELASSANAAPDTPITTQSVTPASSVIDLDVVATVDETADPDGDDLDAYRDHESGRLRVAGALPPGCETVVSVPVGQPLRHYAGVIRRALADAGVDVDRTVTIASDESVMPDANQLASISSPPLADCCRLINRPSDNFMAEQLARTVADSVHDSDSWDAWADLVEDTLAARGAGPARISDGSGLSRYNRIAPRDIVAFLSWALDQSWSDAFLASLPVAGESGTLANRPAEFDATVRAKTGTLTGSRALSGVIETAGGRALFSILLGDLAGEYETAGHDLIDALLVELVAAVT